ncbi:hybrid sensor histidine kinase/response regulator [Dulcicalothrix desertica PCC 7102]|uniref:histidine kinase n=1 Tax=Dulcicalothrix desertica PCC 7102 TaxID=232991 RepID=A0A433UR24_9CYAN|nr:response regulator [Dulcicalothrix desertica]RUS96276.1 hybrid sensor histidine kinase/response regulator [Dulcicalothrix desertica PCC 7102]TWH40399.1 PAS domain S-box-containing protein [Dulcicalothrix desertica PCC 7102]
MSQLVFLLLEDSLLDAELIQATLAEGGITCELIQVQTGEEFQAKLNSSCYDLILSDYTIPGFDGFAALEIAQQQCPEVPFIFVTATMGEEVAIETLKSGATDYVLKQRLDRLVPSIIRALREAEEVKARQKAEAELHRREQEFRALVENSPDIIARFDTNFRTLYISPAITQITDLPPENFLNKTPEEHNLPEQVYQQWVEEIQSVLETSQGRFFELEHPSQTGTRYLDVRMVPEYGTDGTIETILSVARDITVIKRAEIKLREQKAELEELNRVKDEFLAVLSHELRSPLNAILGWSKILRGRNVDKATLERALETIERNAKLQTQLIEDLLDVSRIIRGKLSLKAHKTNLVPAIEAAIDTMRLAAQAKSIDFRFSILDFASHMNKLSGENPKFEVLGDPNRLQQIVWNLLSNAIKFTPNTGRVEIVLERVERTNTTDTNFAQITVKDTGMGIRSDFIPYVFDSFRQADGSSTRRFGGLGLGLAIVRHLVELHGGNVSVQSPGEGKGATFIVRIPMVKSAESKVSRAEPKEIQDLLSTQHSELSTQNLVLSGIRVLVVDDDTDSRDFLAFALEASGAEIASASSATEALNILPTFKPMVLVSDIGMPDQDGYSLMRQIRELPYEKGGAVPAIALTAYAGDADKKAALAAGFQTHLPKPVAPDDIVNAVSELVKT